MRMQIRVISALVLIIAGSVWTPAQIESSKTAKNPDALQTSCPNWSKTENLCNLVTSRSLDPNPIGYNRYLYQRRIMEAACVVNEPDIEKQAEKISKMWEKYDERLTCSGGMFDVVRGSIIKYAVALTFDEFLDDMIAWKVNLNIIDKSDGLTVLDYLKAKIEQNRGNDLGRKLQHYQNMLREEGAKFGYELKKQ